MKLEKQGDYMVITYPDVASLIMLNNMKKFKPRSVKVDGTTWSYLIKEFPKAETALLKA